MSILIGFAEEYKKFFTEAYENRDEFEAETIDDFVKASQLESHLDDGFYRALGALQRAQTARRGASSGEKSK